jgi:hypothetical protein
MQIDLNYLEIVKKSFIPMLFLVLFLNRGRYPMRELFKDKKKALEMIVFWLISTSLIYFVLWLFIR